MDAPLSSPAAHQRPAFQSYFHSTSSSTSSSSSSTSTATSSGMTNDSRSQQTQQQPSAAAASLSSAHFPAAPQAYQPPRPPVRSTDNTGNFLQDFSLVAEAAKRAQMAVLMREMESVGL